MSAGVTWLARFEWGPDSWEGGGLEGDLEPYIRIKKNQRVNRTAT